MPVTRDQPFFNLRRTVMNADPVRHLPTPVFPPRAGTAFGMTETQPANHFRAQLTTRQAA